MGWINPMILIISWTTLLICFYDIIVTSYAQKYQKCIDLGDSGVLSMNKKIEILRSMLPGFMITYLISILMIQYVSAI